MRRNQKRSEDVCDVRLLTPQQAAEVLAIPLKSLHALCRDGRLAYVRINRRGERRFTADQLQAFVEGQTVSARNPVDKQPRRALPSPRKGGEKEVVGVEEKGLSSLRKEIEALCQ
ncbi:MAG: helix-turn-helix domain-containing protein [Deltaproteobacteria bacterium]|nr:helix-turn-helix domain-containing protein [Deltaproteobacteria bacterium]